MPRLFKNILSNLVQAILGALLLFLLYRYINASLGVEKLGVWAVVLSTVSVSRLVDLGLSAGVTRFVARDRALGDFSKASQVVDTSFLTIWCAVGFFLPFLYLIIKCVLPFFLDGNELLDAINILPYVLISFWLTVGSAVFLGGIAGCERMDLQAGVVIAGQTFLLVLAMHLVPNYGLNGLAYAQIGQSLFTLTMGRILLCRILPSLHKFPRSWTKPIFKEVFNYGANIQASTAAQLIFETSTKLMMARFGGTAAVGYFEMANQLVMRVRMVIVSANQAIVPHVAKMNERQTNQLKEFYVANMCNLIFITLPIFTILIVWSDVFSWLIVGVFQKQFIDFIWILCAAWVINIFNVPAYFINMGTGKLKWNTLSHVFMALFNVGIGFVAGHIFGAIGVVYSYAAALTLGSTLLMYKFRVNSIRTSSTQPYRLLRQFFSNSWLFVGCVISIIVVWQHPIRVHDSLSMGIMLTVMIPTILILLLMWIHPTRKNIMASINSKNHGD